MAIITPAVATATPTRLGTYLRNRPVSGSIVQEDYEDLLNYLIDLPDESFDYDGLVCFDKILGDLEYIGRVSETTVYGPHVQTDDAYIGRPDADETGGAIFNKNQPEKIYLKNLPKKGEPGGKEVEAADELEKKTEWEKLIARLEKLLGEGYLRATPSSSRKRAYAKKWYLKNRSRLAAKRKKLKSATKRKRKEVMSRQRKTKFGKPQKKYPSAKNHTNERTSFADTVKPLSEKHSVKNEYKPKGKVVYLIADSDFSAGELLIRKNSVFTMIGSDIIFEHKGKKFRVDDPVTVLQYLTRI